MLDFAERTFGMKASAAKGVDIASAQAEFSKVATVILLGTSFKTAPIDFRERFATRLRNGRELKNTLDRIGVLESSVIETCNRVELYLVTNDPEITVKSIVPRLGYDSPDNLYLKIGLDVIGHIFTVSSGLDSLVVGEEQILRQVRDAGRSARVSGSAKSTLSSLFDAAYNVGRRARGLYGNSPPNLSVSAFALKYGLERLGRRPKKVLLIGTGETAKLVLLELAGSKVYLVSRRADADTRFPTATIISRKQLKGVAAKCDLIISATRVPGYVLKKGDVPDDKKRVLLDLAFPRNIDPSMKSSDFLRLYDLDDIAGHAKSHPKSKNFLVTEKFITSEAERFNRWLIASRLTPMLAGIYRWAENIREAETELALRRLSQLSERDRRVVEVMSRRLVSKLMAPHAAFAKQQGGGLSQRDRLQLLESVFGKESGD
jgi:glutamyl-tRNA reductase